MLAVLHAAIRTGEGREVLRLGTYGAALLGLGAPFYLLVRPAGLGSGLWDALPTLLHVVALSTLTVALLRPGRRGLVAACVAWVMINVAFELGQWPAAASAIAWWLDARCGALPCRRSALFFLHGTFDLLDIGAALVGGILTWCALRCRSTQVPS